MRAFTSRALLALTFAAGLNGAAPAIAADAPAAAASQAGASVSPEFAKPFNEAQDLLKAGNGIAALAKLKELDALPSLNAYEKYLLLRVRAPAEYSANDSVAAAKDFEALLANDQLPAADRLQIMKALASILYSPEQYAKATVAIQRYLDAGGDGAQLRELLPQTQYINKDYASAAKGFRAQVDATYAAGKVPTEKTLRLLATSYSQSDSDAGYVWALEHLAVAYPKADYWKELIARGAHTDKFADRMYVDNYRLKARVLGGVNDSERLSYAALAAHAGYPEEAKRILDEAYASKPFTGPDLGEANKLRAEVGKAVAADRAQQAVNEASARSAKDGNALVSLGLLETVDGNAQQGAQLIEQGIAKGGLRYPEEARLHLGYAQVLAGRDADAVKSFDSVTSGPAGIVPIAHTWSLYAQSRLHAAAAPTPAAPASK
ncbi:MAG: hypothetical protein H7276_13985 [Caulobacter sp.]|nr:hypothetical protein [Vitreoscilla sp.]